MRLRPVPLMLLALSCGSVPEPFLPTTPPIDAAIAADTPAICADLDGDGHTSIACGGDDCDDTNPAIHPGLAELCDGVDNNCNRMIDEAPAGQECQPGQICTGGHCGCPATGGTGLCAGAVDAAPRIDTSAGEDAMPAGDVDCPTGNPPSPFPGCKSMPSGACDVVCQTGCGCGLHCKLDMGVPTCNGSGPNTLQPYDSCLPNDDQCIPGHICLQESVDHPACGAHCYRHCRDDGDCSGGARCDIDVQFGGSATSWNVCSAPTEACNPFGPAHCLRADRPYPTFGCYVMSSRHPDLTVCDCAGTIKTGDPCSYEHQCEPGSECVSANSVRICRRTCKVGVTGLPVVGGCPVGTTCTAFPASSTFGYCH